MLVLYAAFIFRISQVKFLKMIIPKTGQIPRKISLNEQFQGSFRLSALIFTENKLHWYFAKVRCYLPFKLLVKVLKFRISCFEVTHISGSF